MVRFKRFTFLCDENERRSIAISATHLQRSRSDAIRYVIVEAVEELDRLGLILPGQYNQVEGRE